MKKLILTCSALLIGASLMAQQTPAEIPSAKPGVEYGAGVPKTSAKAITATELSTKLEKEEKYDGLIEGKVVQVCTKKGCFMRLENAAGEPIMVRFQDYAFFMPQDIVGKTVVLDGRAVMKTESVEAQKQHAMDDGKSAEEIAKITKPLVSKEILARGVRVVK